MGKKLETVEAYLASVSADRRAALERLRRSILSIVPDAEECISYSMPAFRHKGQVVAGFLATAKGCSYFPFSGSTLATLAPELAAYDRTKSALHFHPARPLPKTLVRKLLAARIAEIKTPAKPARRTASRAAAGESVPSRKRVAKRVAKRTR